MLASMFDSCMIGICLIKQREREREIVCGETGRDVDQINQPSNRISHQRFAIGYGDFARYGGSGQY